MRGAARLGGDGTLGEKRGAREPGTRASSHRCFASYGDILLGQKAVVDEEGVL